VPVKALFRLILWVLLITAVAAALGAASVTWWLQRPLPLAGDSIEISIEQGATPRDVADAWVKAGVQVNPLFLYEWFRWSGEARKIRAGSYQIGHGTTPRTLLDKMVRGDQVMAMVRLIEGWTFRQFRTELAGADSLKQTTTAMTDVQVMEAIGAAGLPPEGRFYPDTYAYSKGASDVAVLRRAFLAMQRQLEAAWNERAPNLPLKQPDEALILASIVEKETGVPADRPRIAGVFINRLRVGMALQTDPAVIYGLGASFDGNLRKRDLLADTPYNTYTRTGLPPTPIAMPGKAALMATVRPESTRALYFVSRGDGSSHFSESLAEHNRAVNQYQRAAHR
jgi:UPF0755 protein